MKILVVIDDFFTSNNGTSISAQRFVKEMRNRGHEVRIITYMSPNQLHQQDIYPLPELHVPLFEPLIHQYAFCLAKPVYATIREALEWADIAHVMTPFVLGYFLKKEADVMQVPTTAAFHIQPENITSAIGMGKVKWLNNFVYWLFRHYTYDKYTHVHTPSKFMQTTLREHHYKADIRAISNGIAEDFIYHRTPFKRKEWEGKVVITMVGRLAREKRQDVLIDAVAKSRYADKIQLVLAGKGPMKHAYEQRIRSLQLKNPPVFGYFTKQELLQLLAEADLYVHASDMESEAISCIEAFATGLVPIIANSPLSATPQFALTPKSLFAPGNSRELAQRIDFWIEHPTDRLNCGMKYAKYANNFRLSASVNAFLQMLEEAIHQQTSHHHFNHE